MNTPSTLVRSSRFKKDYKKIVMTKGFREKIFISIIEDIRNGRSLSAKYKDHKLQGEFAGCRECHIQPDVLLIYMVDKEKQIIYLLRIGSHSDLF